MKLKALAQQLAEESIVLLKNNAGCLPLSVDEPLAVFGRAQIDTIYSGNGSGSTHAEGVPCILEALEQEGFQVHQPLKQFYIKALENDPERHAGEIDWSKGKEYLHSGLMYEIFGQYHGPKTEFAVPEELMTPAMQHCQTALLVLSRNAGGEECDRRYEDDYLLTASEKALAAQVCDAFECVILVLNINGLIDLSWTEAFPQIRGILFLGIPGECGATALVRILSGRVTPSGKLAFTWARQAEDWPSWQHFSSNKEHPLTYADYGLVPPYGSQGFSTRPVTVYAEDVYMGYRYVDTFGVQPLYSFGYGLSYTDFEIRFIQAEKHSDGLSVHCEVRNIGSRAGKETVQIYAAPESTESPCPNKALIAFTKTCLLPPGETEQVTLHVPWQVFRVYDEHCAAWRVEQGQYVLRLGNSIMGTQEIAFIRVPETVPLQFCANRLNLQSGYGEKVRFLRGNDTPPEAHPNLPVIILCAGDIQPQQAERPVEEIPEKIHEMSNQQLAAFCVGYGPGTPFSAFQDTADPETIFDETGQPLTVNDHPVGQNGYVSPAIPAINIHSVYYKDGPAGIGRTAWPTEMLLACSWNEELLYRFGDAVGAECEEEQVNVWLGPAVNLLRHPLCGRNFEYFSEDPLLTGACAVAVAKGVQENHPVLVCAKHFALNEQETYRRGNSRKHVDAVDSIVSERAARELYLRPFEMLVRQGDVHCLMTSFNKINGTFAGGNADLCTPILREEWGFDGLVVTDWGDMDIVVDGADAVAAGNDVIMPGGPPVIRQILLGLGNGRVRREELERSASRLFRITRRIGK